MITAFVVLYGVIIYTASTDEVGNTSGEGGGVDPPGYNWSYEEDEPVRPDNLPEEKDDWLFIDGDWELEEDEVIEDRVVKVRGNVLTDHSTPTLRNCVIIFDTNSGAEGPHGGHEYMLEPSYSIKAYDTVFTVYDARYDYRICIGHVGGNSTFKGCEFTYCEDIYASGGSISFEDCTFRNNGVGIHCKWNCVITVEHCLFEGNRVGIQCSDGGTARMTNNTFGENEYYDVQSVNTETVAEYNYWGTVDREEIQAKISGDVDFDPWLTHDPL